MVNYLQQKVFLVCGLLSLHLCVFAQDLNNAFTESKALGQAYQQQALDQISIPAAQQHIPNYTDQAKESSLFEQGNGALFMPGKGKITHCASGPKANTGYQQQECDVVNFLAKNPQQRPKIVIDKNDALITGAKQIIDHAKANGTYSGCEKKTEGQAHWIQEETCTESFLLEEVKCRRGFSPDIGTIVAPKTLSINRGSEVPPWSARTFDIHFEVDGEPSAFFLKYYRMDNYGQLWINQTLIYGNALHGVSDMRGGRVSGSTFFTQDGQIRSFGDDGCNWGCRGVSLNIDLTPHIRKGTNTITLVCANANAIGPCAVNIIGSVTKLVMLGSLIDNQCATLEERSR